MLKITRKGNSFEIEETKGPFWIANKILEDYFVNRKGEPQFFDTYEEAEEMWKEITKDRPHFFSTFPGWAIRAYKGEEFQ